MKLTSGPLYLRILAILLALSFSARLCAQLSTRTYVEPPRQEIIHAYLLLKYANNNYNGHRAKAMEHVAAAGRALHLRLEGDVVSFEHQWKSDQKLAQARYLLFRARDAFVAHDRQLAARHVNRAIGEIDSAISRSRITPPPAARPVG